MPPVTPHPAPDDPDAGLEQPPAAPIPTDVPANSFQPPAPPADEDDWDNWDDDEEEEDEDEPARPPGPGLFEALVWCVGLQVVQLFAIFPTIILIALWVAVAEGAAGREEMMRNPQAFAKKLDTEYQAGLFGGIMFFFVLTVLAASRLRIGAGMARKLALQSLSPMHGLLIALAVLPISFLSGQVYAVAEKAWKRLTQGIPGVELLDQMNTMEAIKGLAEVPLPVLWLIMAVAPAISEELVFRGVISRGLLARWGVFWGVLITTLLFAMVHLHPVHVIGVIPLGWFMHYTYLTSRSFWAPMMYHFLNNAWAAFAMKYLAGSMEAEELPPLQLTLMVGLSLLSIGLVVTCLWQSRLYFRRNDTDAVYVPPWPTVEHPPADIAHPCRERIHPVTGILTALAVAAFYAVILFTEEPGKGDAPPQDEAPIAQPIEKVG